MFEKFQKAVRNAYLVLKLNNKLVFVSRERPSTKDLRDWSYQILVKGLAREDLIVFHRFFNPQNSDKDLESIVNTFDLDKLRNLRNFIIGSTTYRAQENVVKLLAILIDFQPRPYCSEDWKESSTEPEITTSEENFSPNEATVNIDIAAQDNELHQPSVEPPEITNSRDSFEERYNQPKDNQFPIKENDNKNSNTITKGSSAVYGENSAQLSEDNNINKSCTETTNGTKDGPSTSADSNIINTEKSPINPTDAVDKKYENDRQKDQIKTPGNIFLLKKKKQKLLLCGAGVLTCAALAIIIFDPPLNDCMCWNGEKYIEVDCQSKTQPYQVIGLDKNKLEGFVKITRPDTLGPKDVGRVWYSKINHEVEFFTGPGYHPTEFGRSLKAATTRILDSYAGANAKSDQNKKYGIIQKQ
ncbi:hypothetical protein [Sphingobacterium siyangense]|uniref:hypothetical protein n=1 Tax=Sphingobacterium siyangense TaxID=459529 RepID=UPI003DA61834